MTTLNLDDLPAAERARQIRIGRRYGSGDTLAQATDSLNAYAKYTAPLNAHGFGAEDAEHLADCKGFLSSAIGGREGCDDRPGRVLADGQSRRQIPDRNA